MRETELLHSHAGHRHRHRDGHWSYCEPTEHVDLRDKNAVIQAYQPMVSLSLGDFLSSNIMETTYKELASMIDEDFLRQGIRARELRTVRLNTERPWRKHNPRGPEDIIVFDIPSSHFGRTRSNGTQNNIIYQNSVRFMQWEQVLADHDLTPAEAARMLLWVGDIQLHCTCPSFLYHGMEYLLTVLDAAIEPVDIKPIHNNPHERGIVCKHMNRCLRSLPFYLGDIAKEIKHQRGARRAE